MGHSYGKRAGTRYAYSRGYKNHGQIRSSVYLHQYKVGDMVDVVVNGAVQKGMPFKYYHGKTGVVYNVTQNAVGVILYKPVRNRYLEKRVNVRIEHVRASRSREDFLRRVKRNAAMKRQAKEKGEAVEVKRKPAMPRGASMVKIDGNRPESIAPIAYDTAI